ncbi:VWA domain-containing protein [Alloscardovia venturai]|uniref:VWA domain-containing protein n=1 Tax=Alloscardovia venturai TaxID=1769421 RepID=A0ABW2YAZ3_9BIFI
MLIAFSPIFGWVCSLILIALILLTAVWMTVNYARHKTRTDTTVWSLSRRLVLAVLLVAIILAPSTHRTVTTRAISTTDVFIAVDVTGSMGVSDAQYGATRTISRIKAAQKAITDITKQYPDASFSAINFGSTSAVTVPLTPDAQAVTSWASTLKTEPTNASAGSSLDKPLNTLTTAMNATMTSHPQDTIVLYYISDGEQTSGESVKSFSVLRKYVKKSYVIGLGSEDGGKIPYTTAGISSSSTSSPTQWVQDPDTHSDGISRLSPENLKKIADQLSGTYIQPSGSTTIANTVQDSQSSSYRLTSTTRNSRRVVPLIWPFALLFTIVAVWEIIAWIATSRKLLSL